MREDIRRVTGTILRAPFTRRTVRELLYCGIGGTARLIPSYRAANSFGVCRKRRSEWWVKGGWSAPLGGW